ncbi:MAG: SUMF1/EgtB/PvdO family nonheme iron enzyme, partial [Saprospiraceae bacterium]|nr:SUMF1/EgtB/PvdO family nonheme iron enzyme [Saprospiraceae bacterium]
MMKRYLLPLLCAALLPAAAAAQTRLFVRHACAVDNAEMNQSHYVFDPSNEAQQIISAIMNANILDPNFIIRSGDVANALATFENGQRYIIYNTAYIERIKSSAGTDWAAFFVFAHEIGHHLNNHRFDLSDEGARKEQELRADVFAGGMLYRLGASLAEAQRGVEAVCKERETATHPPRRARLEAVANGWRRAKEQNPAQPERLRLDLGGVAAPVTAPATTPGEDDPLGLVLVRGGTFTMGCTSEQQDCNEDETPAHRVTVSDFYIGRHEVTQRIWAQIMGSNPSR